MTKKLTAVEQREVIFYDDALTAVQVDDGRVYVSVRHMCQALGIDDQGQRQRINRHNVLMRGLMVCKIHTIQGERETHVLRVDLVPLWLSGIRTSTVNEKVRPKLEKFQEEAADVLWEAFQEGHLTTEPAFDDLLKSDSPAAQAYQMVQAIMQMARQQLILESRLDNHENRLEAIEVQMSVPSHAISESQAMQISQAVGKMCGFLE